MSDKELAAIRERQQRAFNAALVKPDPEWLQPVMAINYYSDVKALIDENAALREIVEAVANGEFDDSGYNNHGYCRCDPDYDEATESWQHKPDCLITKARTLVQKE